MNKAQVIFCISTFAVFLSSVECQYPGQFSPYDAQSFGGGGFGDFQQPDPFLVSFRNKATSSGYKIFSMINFNFF